MSIQPIGGIQNNPYTLDHWNTLRKTQAILHTIAPLIDKAEKCGIACSDLRAMHDGMAQSLELLQQHFFSPPPVGPMGN